MREVQGDAVHEARTTVSSAAFARSIAVATGAALLFTLVGAFGTDQVTLWRRLAYWFIVMGTGALLGIGAMTGVRAWGRLAARPLLEGALISVLIAVPLTLAVVGTTLALLGRRPPSAAGFALQFIAVLAISATITTLNYLISRPPPPPVILTSPVEPDAQPPKLLERLPHRLRHAALIAIEAEDHYLRIHTSAGSDLILLRLRDAVAELDGVEGAQVHRSWWVARAAIEDIDRGEGRTMLKLTGGVEAPVSRRYLPELRERGWL